MGQNKRHHSSFLFYDIYQCGSKFTIEGIEGMFFDSAMACRQYIAFHAPVRDKELQLKTIPEYLLN